MANQPATQKPGTPAKGEPTPTPVMDIRQRMDSLFDQMMHDWPMPSFGRDFWSMRPAGARLDRPFGNGMVDVSFEVAESDDAIEITAELPGIDEDNVELSVNDGVLTVRGEKKAETEEKQKDYYLAERRYGAFQRAFRIPDSVDQDKIAAKFNKGVLHLTLPKHAEVVAKKKTIPIGKG